ncbi:type II toxin-antitoxin system PemK/MazF family toxin [Cumulibacter soli]|uniref:type II toxin-antitoxin system PemK/MazF family toxin n=1 Tax=Cumulibacter soli TaxID=2546344 RepID=UPI001068D1AF|nr:type II toxin-antitoxin system PemK/MazF family toxin [Cumulibacter soli]
MANGGTWARILSGAIDLFTKTSTKGSSPKKRGRSSPPRPASAPTDSAGQSGGTATQELNPHHVKNVRLEYAPNKDGDPDAGEIVWTWVPYAEHDGRGKDRPVLVIARHGADRVYAVKLTSKDKDGDRDFLPIGSGPWDSQGRESWLDVDQLYSVHRDGMRREAAALDFDRFTQIAYALQQRFGWKAGS